MLRKLIFNDSLLSIEYPYPIDHTKLLQSHFICVIVFLINIGKQLVYVFVNNGSSVQGSSWRHHSVFTLEERIQKIWAQRCMTQFRTWWGCPSPSYMLRRRCCHWGIVGIPIVTVQSLAINSFHTEIWKWNSKIDLKHTEKIRFRLVRFPSTSVPLTHRKCKWPKPRL